MRLRQAHAMIEAAIALESAGLGIRVTPFDHDLPGSLVDEDRMDGDAEFTDPDAPDGTTRRYGITIKPGPGQLVLANVTFGLDLDTVLWEDSFGCGAGADEIAFRGLVGAQIAARISKAIRDYETPYRAAYELRSGKKWSQA
ncbi:hypothetical protein ABZ341_18380 [Streptomyces sp. NPDC006173]|uniref:hypothetical protein n=1 Tax=Streptomyces sp. NPDC006173 TaxID=3155349 RepID=UPI0033E05654